MKEAKYYIFKFKLKRDEEFCEECNLIDTHLLILGYNLTWKEREMEYALDQFLKTFDGHDITNFCIIPSTIFNDSCIYEHIGGKVYLISPTFLTDRNLVRYRYPELVNQVYDEDLTGMNYIPVVKDEPEEVTLDLVRKIFEEGKNNG
jgi:hypothetical protein